MSGSHAEVVSSRDRPAAVARAVQALQDGLLIGLPTETVYGVAGLLTHNRAVEKLRQLVGVQGHPVWVPHLAGPQEACDYVADIPVLARRLMRKLWPGPVSLQLPVSSADIRGLETRLGKRTASEAVSGGRLTLRCPDNDMARAILAGAGAPVAVIGAGTSRAVFEVDDIPASIGGHLALVVDDGRTRYHKPSTVVGIHEKGLVIAREGVIAERLIRSMADQVILFVCSGNTCRSPLAAGITTKLIAARLGVAADELSTRGVRVESAGLYATADLPATAEAVQVARELGADISRHRSRRLTDDLLRRADVIYTMTNAHRRDMLSRSSAAGDKIFLLDPEGDIADPIGGDVDRYRQTAQRLEAILRRRLGEMIP